MRIRVICIQCPLGCEIEVERLPEGGYRSLDAYCKAGERYAIEEVRRPLRVLTSTVRVHGGDLPVVSVRTSCAVPKESIPDCLRELRSLRFRAPLTRCEVLVEDLAQTGCDLVATRTVSVIS